MANPHQHYSKSLKQSHNQEQGRAAVCYPHSFSIVLEVIAGTIRQEKKMKKIQVGKRSQIFPICRWFDTVSKRSQNFYHKMWRNKQQFQQSGRFTKSS